MATKGGGHSKGQTMPYTLLIHWEGGKELKRLKWTIGAARESMAEVLRAANVRGGLLDTRIVDRATGETVVTPTLCPGCGERWATEVDGLCRACSV